MINIKQIPQRTLGAKEISGTGHTLTLDGEDFDLSLLADGDTAINSPEDSKIIKATRNSDVYELEVLVWFDPHAEDYDSGFDSEVITL